MKAERSIFYKKYSFHKRFETNELILLLYSFFYLFRRFIVIILFVCHHDVTCLIFVVTNILIFAYYAYFINYRYRISINWIELFNELCVSFIGYTALYIQLTDHLNIRYYSEIIIIAILLLNLLVNAIR